MAQPLICPFCGYSTTSEYDLQLHIEEDHTEDSPFAVTERRAAAPRPPLPSQPSASTSPSASSAERSSGEDNPWIKCTRPECGEYIAVADLDEHYRFHEDIQKAQDEDSSPRKTAKRPTSREESRRSDEPPNSPKRQRQRPQSRPTSSSNASGNRSILDWITGSSTVAPRPPPRHRRIEQPREPGRLGRRELGPHAFEDRMPDAVRRTLLTGAEASRKIAPDGRLSRELNVDNETRGLIPILSNLCNTDRTTTATYLCDPAVRHVVKLRCDGNFCGYWNIQMLLSYLYSSHPHRDGSERQLPHILEIQDNIERAWDAGICSYGRIETGGVRNSRKWIGTHEALAYFTQCKIDVEALTFREDEDNSSTSTPSQPAVLSLLDHIEAYFISALEHPRTKHYGRSHITPLPPVYFQRFGHSTTIVGVERKASGERNLLVFDPSFATTAAAGRWLAGRTTFAWPETILKAYRRSELALSRWSEFEIIVPKVTAVDLKLGSGAGSRVGASTGSRAASERR